MMNKNEKLEKKLYHLTSKLHSLEEVRNEETSSEEEYIHKKKTINTMKKEKKELETKLKEVQSIPNEHVQFNQVPRHPFAWLGSHH